MPTDMVRTNPRPTRAGRTYHSVALLLALAYALIGCQAGESGNASVTLAPATSQFPQLPAEVVASMAAAPVVATHTPSREEQLLRDSLLAALPATTRPLMQDILSDRLPNVAFGLANSDTLVERLIARYMRVRREVQVGGPLAADAVVSVWVARPLRDAPPVSRLVQDPTSPYPNLLVLASSDLQPSRLAQVLDLTKTRLWAAPYGAGETPLGVVRRDESVSPLSGVRSRRTARLSQALQTSTAVEVPALGAAQVTLITMPSRAVANLVTASRHP